MKPAAWAVVLRLPRIMASCNECIMASCNNVCRSNFAMSFYDAATVRLEYSGLDSTAAYNATVVFNSQPEPIGQPARARTIVDGNGSSSSSVVVVAAAGSATSSASPLLRIVAQGAAAADDEEEQEQEQEQHDTAAGVPAVNNVSVAGWGAPVTIWPDAQVGGYAPPPVPMQQTTFAVPQELTRSGRLALSCEQTPGVAGNGRACEIAQVWLVKVEADDA
jgi:hypothetical protein